MSLGDPVLPPLLCLFFFSLSLFYELRAVCWVVVAAWCIPEDYHWSDPAFNPISQSSLYHVIFTTACFYETLVVTSISSDSRKTSSPAPQAAICGGAVPSRETSPSPFLKINGLHQSQHFAFRFLLLVKSTTPTGLLFSVDTWLFYNRQVGT